MTTPLNILIIEDNPDDAELIELELQRAGYAPRLVRVDSAASLKKELEKNCWDAIISDFNMPGFDGLEALSIVKKSKFDLPFIIVSGTVGEETAVETVVAGAHDYVMKDNLKRVPVAVRREIQNKKLRDQKRDADAKIRESLKEKEVMLKEIHHRVKNNLAVISALLALQSDYVKDQDSKQLFQETVDRIKSMALIHEKLYQSEMLSKVAMDVYLRDLARYIEKTYSTTENDIEIDLQIDATNLEITKAIPCGLIVNELLNNAFKHAFQGRISGKIQLKLEKMAEENRCLLEVSDNGTGIPDEIARGETDTLGFTIIQGLAGQLSAELDINQQNGTRVSLSFKS